MKIAVYGYGTMGKLLCSMILENTNLELFAAIEPRQVIEEDSVVSSLEQLENSFDVLIDFSHPTNIQSILSYCTEHKKPLVICTTGFEESVLTNIKKAAEFIPIVLASNTSQGVSLMHQLVTKAVKTLAIDFDIEIIEAHHNKKIDAPSGTAASLLETVQNALPENYNVQYGRNGMSKRTNKEIGLHSLRAGTIVGEHTVILAGEGEIVTIKHTALSKSIFAKGAIRAAQFVHLQPVGLYSMEDVIAN